MKYELNGITYEVIITRKNNKNTYIRVKEDLNIYVTTSYFVTKRQIKSLLDKNKDTVNNMINRLNKKIEKNNYFYFLGNKYDVIIVSNLVEKIKISDDKIFVESNEYLNKWLKKEMGKIFKERIDYNYNLFIENIPYPKLRIRKMTTRWGVCNRKNNIVTLNSELIKYDINVIDYVIIHELSHFVHFNHSKNFWLLVFKYCENYKKIRQILKEG